MLYHAYLDNCFLDLHHFCLYKRGLISCVVGHRSSSWTLLPESFTFRSLQDLPGIDLRPFINFLTFCELQGELPASVVEGLFSNADEAKDPQSYALLVDAYNDTCQGIATQPLADRQDVLPTNMPARSCSITCKRITCIDLNVLCNSSASNLSAFIDSVSSSASHTSLYHETLTSAYLM